MKPFGWFMPATLIALGRFTAHASLPFTVTELQKIVPELAERSDARLACQLLEQRKLVMACTEQRNTWELTSAGLATCKAAMNVSLVEGKCKPALIRVNKSTSPSAADQLAPRLWALLRIRKVLTSLDAVQVLADAGDNTTYLQAVINRLLRAWREARPDALEISKKRANGSLRYVLKLDIGPQPPALAKAKKEAA
ncbi:hypothetical protein [Comamonas fluminis]|uniref:hypothetical protein n=1 Tax=Comamonas fluminis TaxID=2796366 RepID=UPI001C44CA3F|nr:hypothetical protein [Comamonas fluminis]